MIYIVKNFCIQIWEFSHYSHWRKAQYELQSQFRMLKMDKKFKTTFLFLLLVWNIWFKINASKFYKWTFHWPEELVPMFKQIHGASILNESCNAPHIVHGLIEGTALGSDDKSVKTARLSKLCEFWKELFGLIGVTRVTGAAWKYL